MRSPNLWMVIPTYWGDHQLGDFDHPTPLDGDSTLPRLLDSICGLDYDAPFKVLLLAAGTDEQSAAAAADRVKMIATDYADLLQIYVVGRKQAAMVHARIEDASLRDWLKIERFDSYAAIRNMQLIVPWLNEADLIAAIDDDEVLPPHYLKQVVKWIGSEIDGEKVHAVCGPYLDAAGSPFINAPEVVRNALKDKSFYMNQAAAALTDAAGQGIIRSPLAFGGNMLFDAYLAERICFDPALLRGEDIDYLINARIDGIPFYFDPGLTITHLPPRHYESDEYAKRGRDVKRFIYEQRKVMAFALSCDDLDPYPGMVLKQDLIRLGGVMLNEAYSPSVQLSPDALLEQALHESEAQLLGFQENRAKWQTMLTSLKAIRDFGKTLLE